MVSFSLHLTPDEKPGNLKNKQINIILCLICQLFAILLGCQVTSKSWFKMNISGDLLQNRISNVHVLSSILETVAEFQWLTFKVGHFAMFYS